MTKTRMYAEVVNDAADVLEAIQVHGEFNVDFINSLAAKFSKDVLAHADRESPCQLTDKIVPVHDRVITETREVLVAIANGNLNLGSKQQQRTLSHLVIQLRKAGDDQGVGNGN